MKGYLTAAAFLLLLYATPQTARAVSTSLADLAFPTYGAASHLDQYVEYLGADGTAYDGLSFAASVLVGSTFDLTVTTWVDEFFGDGFENLGVWIDWDQSRTFEETERVVDLVDYEFGLGTTEHHFSITVPDLAAIGETWMRARFTFDGRPDPFDEVEPVWTGEVEDYGLRVTVPEPSAAALLMLLLAPWGLRKLRR